VVSPLPADRSFISGVNAINPLVTFYDIHGRKRAAILLFYTGHRTRLARNLDEIAPEINFLPLQLLLAVKKMFDQYKNYFITNFGKTWESRRNI
jgi:hypothetical protein